MSDPTAVKIESQNLNVGALFKDFYSVPDYADLAAIAAQAFIAITQRKDMLTNLARKVWTISNGKSAAAGSESPPQTAEEVGQ
ncbi:MAG: hypothetical protein GX945_16255 [Lentisphaerae bacterium]|nr:hypothetical protein [Lentisphaerota bacterium]